jgi:hypothetical protein
MPMWERGGPAGAILMALVVCFALGAGEARAAGAFVVDDAGVDDPGKCKVETWGSFADNHDMVGVVSPTCSFNIIQPVELNAGFARFRDAGEWGTELVLKAKTRLFESGKFSAAVNIANAFDLLEGRHSAVFVNVPFTYEATEQFKLNAIAGWLWNRNEDEHLFTWGLGVEYKPADKFTLIAEVFGFAGSDQSDPRFQAGLRITPMPAIDFDFIYGRNILGTEAHWFTFGINVRFDATERNGTNGLAAARATSLVR